MENPIRKRRRPAVSCTQCRRRKVKCDRGSPCAPCVISSLTCAYDPSYPTTSTTQNTVSVIQNDAGSAAGLAATAQDATGSDWESFDYFAGLDDQIRTYGDSRAAFSQPATASSGVDYGGTPYFADTSFTAMTNGSGHRSVPKSNRSCLSRATHLGHSHWKNVFEQFDKMKLVFNTDEPSTPDEVSEVVSLLSKCQQLSRSIKIRRSDYMRSDFATPSTGLNLPPKTICDRLVHLYLNTFETVFRVVHVPSFWSEYQAYWESPPAENDAFHQKLLLIMAIGTCFYYESEEQECPLRLLASKWIYDVQKWLVYTFEMAEPNMDALQVSCLLLLARQTDMVGSDLIWISADLPLKIAMSEGLHKEPSIHFPNMPVFEAEMRKRLWATILEMSIQMSLDSGLPPPISYDDFDCRPPSDVDDDRIGPHMEGQIPANHSGRFTQSSVQVMLMSTVRLRLKILQSLTALKLSLTYQDALKLSSDVEAICRSHTAFINSCLADRLQADTKPTDFQTKLLDILMRRFVLALHGPFAIQASSDLTYYFSRKLVAETSLRLLTYPLPLSSSLPITTTTASATISGGPIDYYTRLTLFGGGLFKHALWHASASLCAELITSAAEEDSFPLTQSSSSRTQFLKAVREHVDVLGRRVKAGDTNTETCMLLSCALAEVCSGDAMEEEGKGERDERVFLEAAKRCLGTVCRVLEGLDSAPIAGGGSFSSMEFSDAGGAATIWDSMVHDHDASTFDFSTDTTQG